MAALKPPTRGLLNYTRSRAPIERLQRLANLIRHDLPFSAGEVAKQLEVCRKTIVRDLAFMRERLGWEFQWDASAQRYLCTKKPSPQL